MIAPVGVAGRGRDRLDIRHQQPRGIRFQFLERFCGEKLLDLQCRLAHSRHLMVQDLTQGGQRRITLGADKAYDTRDFVMTIRELKGMPAKG